MLLVNISGDWFLKALPLPTVDTKRDAESLFPYQLGCGTKRGAEAAAYAVRAFLKDASDGTVLLKLDFKNAFNSIRREVIAENHADKMPELTSFFNLCYGNAFCLLVILSSTL